MKLSSWNSLFFPHSCYKVQFKRIIFFAEPSEFEKLVDDNPSSNFFIDEAPVAGEKFSTETLADISKKVSRNNYLWIACQSDKAPHKQDANLEGNYLRLNTNLSNFQRIFFYCYLIANKTACSIYYKNVFRLLGLYK